MSRKVLKKHMWQLYKECNIEDGTTSPCSHITFNQFYFL